MGALIKKTGLHRGTVYNSLNQLLNKGFISFMEEEGIKKYFLKPENLASVLDIKRQEIEKQSEKISHFIKEMKHIPDNAQEITLHVGQNSFKIIFNEILEKHKNSGEEYLFIGDYFECSRVLGDEYLKRIQKIKKDSRVNSRILVNQNVLGTDLAARLSGTVRYLPHEYLFPAATWIFKDKVMITLFNTSPITTLLISNESVAENYRSYFERLWALPVKFEKRVAYKDRLVEMIRKTKKMDILCKSNIAPFFIYPHNEKTFLKYRKRIEKRRKTLTGKNDIDIFVAYKKMWERNTEVRYVVGKESVDSFFKMIGEEMGSREVKRRVANITKSLRKYKVSVRLLEENNPITMYLTDKEFMIAMPSVEDVYGFSTPETEITGTFRMLFQEFWNRSKPLEDYLKKFK